MKKLIIVHNDIGENPSPDDLDTIKQAGLVYEAACSVYDAKILPLKKLTEINSFPPDYIVFNLAEEWDGDGYEAYKIPKALERNRIPFTGAGSAAMKTAGDKVNAKMVMEAAGIPTPPFITADSSNHFISGDYIIKPARQSGSVGISEGSVAHCNDVEAVRNILMRTDNKLRYFAERYIDGREVSVSMIESEGRKVKVLPPREICFDGDNDGFKILDYDSKWIESSTKYKNTVSVIMRDASDKTLICSLEKICLRLWDLFGLRGWARVDFRIDKSGAPFVLEINCNPCLTPPDAGFYLAAVSAGLDFKEIIDGLIRYARF